MAPDDAGHLSLEEARARYFEANGLDAGAYDAPFVRFKVGPLPVAFPNTKGRKRAVRMHDTHHVLTGYDTDVLGEGEIGAWEVASGCGVHRAAWVLNLLAFYGGLFLSPGKVWRAFVRGRRSRNLYAREWDDALLTRKVGELRDELGIPAEDTPAEPGDLWAFTGWGLAALALGIGPTALLLLGLWAVFAS